MMELSAPTSLPSKVAMIDTLSARASIDPLHLHASPHPGAEVIAPLPAHPTHFLARQPILDLKQKLHGYAMLHRMGVAKDESLTPEEAARELVANYRLFIPESTIEKGFVRCTREMLLSNLVELLPSQNTVLQLPADALRVPEGTGLDPAVIICCAALRKKGYRLALEGVTPGELKHPLIELIDYVMLDFQATDRETRREIYRMVNGTKAKPVASKVEKTEEMEAAKREGCQYFQGFFLTSSAVAARRTIPTNQVICLRLMAALSEESTEVKQIESMVMMDTSLTYQLLRRVNSVAYSLNSRVTSIRNALVIVGNDEFRKLVSGALADVFASSQSKTLITIALERAKFCEVLAPRLSQQGPKLYLLGMLSLVDIILQIPMAQVMETLPLDGDMKSALKGEQSQMGIVLELVRGYQAANWEKCELLQQKLGITEREAAKTYMESVHWTSHMLQDAAA